jgi:hypothetical protein
MTCLGLIPFKTAGKSRERLHENMPVHSIAAQFDARLGAFARRVLKGRGRMNRVVGLETEYGCLVTMDEERTVESWPARVKNHLFKKGRVGALDLHYRDYEEPPGNGGFLLNGGAFTSTWGTSNTRRRNARRCAIWLLTISRATRWSSRRWMRWG